MKLIDWLWLCFPALGAYGVFLAFTLGICMGAEQHLAQYITVEWGFTGCHVVKP